jgi:hypothetical protein
MPNPSPKVEGKTVNRNILFTQKQTLSSFPSLLGKGCRG